METEKNWLWNQMNLDLSAFFSLYQLYNQDLFETYPRTYTTAGHDWCHLSHLLTLHSHSWPLSMSPQPQVMPWNLRSANAHTVLELQIQWKLCSITHKSWKDVLFFHAMLCFMNIKVLPCTQCLTEFWTKQGLGGLPPDMPEFQQ